MSNPRYRFAALSSLIGVLVLLALLPASVNPTSAQQPTSTPRATLTPTVTREAAIDATAEATADATIEATVEVTEEATEQATVEATTEATTEPTTEPTEEATVEVTVEATVEPTAESEPLQPGDAISDMLLFQPAAEDFGTISTFRLFCADAGIDFTSDERELAFECDIPALNELLIGDGLIVANNPDALDAAWDVIEWELYLDGQEIDLDAFGDLTFETAAVTGEVIFQRTWAVGLARLQPGVYELRSVIRFTEALGEEIQAGEFDVTYTLNVGRENYSIPCPDAELPTLSDVTPTPRDRIAQPGYVGVTINTDRCGALIATIQPGSPASKSGLREGDVVMYIDAVEITTSQQLVSYVAGKRPGDAVTFTVARDDEVLNITLALGVRPPNFGTPQPTATP
jgi:hypothetical protein